MSVSEMFGAPQIAFETGFIGEKWTLQTNLATKQNKGEKTIGVIQKLT